MRMDRHHEGRGHGRPGHPGHRFVQLAMLKAGRFGAGNFGGGWGGPFGGGDWGDEEGGRRGRGGRGRMFASGQLRLVLLKLIADEPRHGYQLIKAIEELTGGSYAPSPGVVYPTLSLLVDEGLIAESANDLGGEGSRKSFTITAQGEAELVDKQAEVERILARLAEHGEGHRRGPPPQIARALGNLLAVLRATKHAEPKPERLNAIVDILDEAAKRIERL